MTKISNFGKHNSILVSVVPLAMFNVSGLAFFSCGRATLYQTFVFHYLQIMQALLILTISGVTSAAITIAEPHAFGLIHPPEVSGLFAHDYDKDGDGN